MRFGMHSGPVTGGVLRGEKSRFQLFGDTVNTAARMESTGKPQRIQVSQETADLLYADGKGSWLTPRDTLVHAKGRFRCPMSFCRVGRTLLGCICV
jgi:class 3 adenylate cyclase